jgi:hypothetical protein
MFNSGVGEIKKHDDQIADKTGNNKEVGETGISSKGL